jgi:hypothetical protein
VFRKVYTCSRDDIPSSYRKRHAAIFSQKRGDGYWLWKPYLIGQFLNQLKPGEILFYCDSGSHFVSSPAPLIELAAREPSGVLSFCLSHPERHYTKRGVLRHLGVDGPDYTESAQRLASFALFRVCEEAISFVSEWLSFCEDEFLITDLPSPPSIPEYTDIAEHRHDQSLFSLTCKRLGIPAYPDPLQWGNGDPCRQLLYPQILEHTRGVGAPLSRSFDAHLRRFVMKFTR